MTLQQLSQPLYHAVAPLALKSPYVSKLLCVLTSRCNSRCPVCFLWGEEGLVKEAPPQYLQKELPPETWIKFFRTAARRTSSVILTGGEVFLYEGLEAILEELAQLKLPVHLITNGTRFPEPPTPILQKIESLQISVDGFDAKSHAIARPHEDLSVKKDLLQEVAKFAAHRRGTPQIHIGITISRANYAHLPEIVGTIASWKIPVKLTLLHQLFTTREKLLAHYQLLKQEGIRPSYFFNGFVAQPGAMDGASIQKSYLALSAPTYPTIQSVEWVPHLLASEIPRYYEDPTYIPYRFQRQCLAPWLELDIMPSGDATSCPDFQLGNIVTMSFSELWNNERARRMRQLVRTHGSFPGCRVCASLYEY